MRLIEADAVIHVQTYNEMTEDWCVKETTVERALNYWADEGCPSIVDAIPVELIKERLVRMSRRRMDLDPDCVDDAWDLKMQIDALDDLLSEWSERKEDETS